MCACRPAVSILRYFTQFGSFRGALRKAVEDMPKPSAKQM